MFAGIHRNWLFVGIMFFQVAFQVLWVEVPFVSDRIFKTTGLDIDQWMWCLFLASVELVWGQILTLIPMEMIPDWTGPPCKPQNDVPEDGEYGVYSDSYIGTLLIMLRVKAYSMISITFMH